MVTALLFPK